MTEQPRILDVGQCGIDGPRLRRFLTSELNAQVDRADTKDQALSFAARNSYRLVLVNRVLNADRSPGLDVIAALKTQHPDLKIMLVSDQPDAQQQAAALGAVRGFGKSALESEETVGLLRSALAP
jgi:DNA-binding NarL/FixJ family response regulator